MLFSEAKKIQRKKDSEWFDPILHQDTKLFIDPFLVYKTQDPLFKDTYDEMMKFFNTAFKLVAESRGIQTDDNYIKARAMFDTREVNEIYLGYSLRNQGSGMSTGWAKKLTENIAKSINKVKDIKHFEEITLFSEGIGPDFVSDMAANLMKEKLVKYTQNICKSNGIEMKPIKLKNYRFNWDTLKWEDKKVELPENIHKKNKGVILIPMKFLRELPEINSEDFKHYIYNNELLRDKLNLEIGKNLKKEELIPIILENYYAINNYIKDVKNREGTPYDLSEDKSLWYRWYERAKEIASDHPLEFQKPSNVAELNTCLLTVANHIKEYIEQASGYYDLWDSQFKKYRSENAAKLLFTGICEQILLKNDIKLILKESSKYKHITVNTVDLKEKSSPILFQIKLANNTQYWSNISKYIDDYYNSTGCKYGILTVIEYTDSDYARVKEIQNKISTINKKNKMSLKLIIIDAIK